MLTRIKAQAATTALLAILSSLVHAGPGVIDFETLPGGGLTVDQQEISNEYFSLGVTFFTTDANGAVNGTPNIARIGDPGTAFASCNGQDTPLPNQNVGLAYLTDDTILGWSANLLIVYSTPVAQASGVILDVDCRNCIPSGTCDSCEQWSVEARNSRGDVIDTFIINGPPGAPQEPCNDTGGPGDAKAFGWFFNHAQPDITAIAIRYTGNAPNVGLAFDNFSPSSIPDFVASVTPPVATLICAGEPVMFSGDVSGGIPPYTFSWQRETALQTWVEVGQGNPFNAYPIESTTFRGVVTDAVGNMFTSDPYHVDVQDFRIEVSQESAPGAGDFDSNVLGFVRPYETDLTASEYYDWTLGTPSFNGPQPSLTDNRSHMFLVAGEDGVALYTVHDDGAGPTNGRAEMRLELNCDTGIYVARDDPSDDPNDIFMTNGTVFDVRNVWGVGRTDGYAVGPLSTCRWVAYVQFLDLFSGSPTIGGLDSWSCYSSSGGMIQLALEEGRRVRLRIYEDPSFECRGDIVTSTTILPPPDGKIDGADLAYLLGAWGDDPCSIADLVTSATFSPPPDGLVDGADLAQLLGNWGPCM